MAEVVLTNRLRAIVEKLNPSVSPNAVEIAVQEVTKDRSALSPARANQAVYQLLKNGVKVTYKGTGDDDQEETVEIVTLIDWNEPEKNDYLLASQFWISGDYGRKRADLVGFVNGIPLRLHRTEGIAQEAGTGLRDEPVRLVLVVIVDTHRSDDAIEPPTPSTEISGGSSPRSSPRSAKPKYGWFMRETGSLDFNFYWRGSAVKLTPG